MLQRVDVSEEMSGEQKSKTKAVSRQRGWSQKKTEGFRFQQKDRKKEKWGNDVKKTHTRNVTTNVYS